MTYYGSKELAASFLTVRNNTIKLAEEIPEDQYGFRPTPECRSVAETLVHIAVAPRLQQQIQFVERRSSLVGFDFFAVFGGLIGEEKTPRTKAEIIALLRSEGDRYASLLSGVTEELLAETVQFPEGMQPPTKSRFEMLIAPKEHEMHHRGQLMVSQRLLGLTPHLTRQMNERIASMKAAAGN
jgi:uncharacterized damage-inducible protein DinB